MTTTKKKACVILGAGASHDVHGPGSSIFGPHPSPPRGNEFQPPLAKHLFDIGGHPRYREILEHYPGADHLAQTLAVSSMSDEFNLEEELRRLKEHPRNPETRENFKQIPPYLRDLLYVCSEGYTASPSSYSQLLQHLVADASHEVLFMVLNYDNLFEKAISLYNPSHQFKELYDYVNPNRSIKVVKFHGSINWFWSMGEGGWYEQLREFDLDNPPDQIAVINDVTRVSEYPKDNQKYYPVLTAPLAGKGLVDAVCPKNHLEAAREFLEYCTKFLVIGTSGQDEDLLEFLDDAVRVEPELVDVVDPIDPQAVLARFRAGIRSFRQPGVEFQKRTHQTQFRKYVADEAIRAFGIFEA